MFHFNIKQWHWKVCGLHGPNDDIFIQGCLCLLDDDFLQHGEIKGQSRKKPDWSVSVLIKTFILFKILSSNTPIKSTGERKQTLQSLHHPSDLF